MESKIKVTKTSFAAKNVLIDAPGIYEVIAGNSNLQAAELNGKLGKDKHIVNLRAIAAHNEEAVLALFEGRDEIEIEELNGLTMTHNIVVNTGRENVPMPGQKVKINVDFVKNKAGEDVLVVTSMFVPKVSTGKSFFPELSDRLSATEGDETESKEVSDKKEKVNY
jgi:hypothetical protein